MNKLFYPKLALINIKKNSQTYVPYIITCVCTMVMFYIMHAISINEGLNEMSGGENLKIILTLGVVVIGIFSAIFLFYTNSFLIKRRKKELGLYNVLGLEKRHIAKILFFENMITSLVSLAIGLSSGIVLNKLMFMFFLRLLSFKVPLGFSISMASLIVTAIVFISIFFVTLLTNLLQIKIANPIELLKGGQTGEKEPKTKWIRAVIGVFALAYGYGLALSVESPLEALNQFFVAVLFVILATYQLFTAGSIAILKLLRKNKKFYYRSRNFISVSSMIYRMKQNAVGLANICILSTAVLVMLSTTFSLYVGMEDALKYRYPKDIQVMGREMNEDEILKLTQLVDTQLSEDNLSVSHQSDYNYMSVATTKKEGKFYLGNESAYSSDYGVLVFISVSDYNRLEEQNVVLADDEVLLFSTSKNYGKKTITIDDQSYYVKQELEEVSFANKNEMDIVETYLLIVNDINTFGEGAHRYEVSFDTENSDEEMMTFVNCLNRQFKELGLDAAADSIASNRESFLSMYGGLFFLGIFLGSLFLMATVLIIYYKQISEGYDDKERFEIMQKVGMSRQEIKKTIRMQILLVFFLPLAFATLHIAFAFPIITKLLAVLNLVNGQLFLITTIITIIIFALIYGIIFALTARTYYKIVE